MKMITKEDLIGQLKEKGLKITPQRVAIIDALVENREVHPGATQIFNEARKKAKRVSLSTVYATLKEFSENGLIKQLEFDRMENRYDGNLSEHINLICKRCGTIIDYHLPPTIEPKDIARKAGFVVTDTRMEYYGYCRDCLKKPESSEK
jgi:Fur family transcriptional regulator, peroxide stress response regulator